MANIEQFSANSNYLDLSSDEQAPAPRTDKLQQQVEELCGATIRAVSGEKNFRFRGRRPEINGQSSGIRAPHLQPDLTKDDYQSFRGAADGIALRLKHSNIELHQQLNPESAVGQVIFELLEQLRVESLVSQDHPGAKANLNHRYQQWCSDFSHSEMIENQVGLLVYTIAQVVWARLNRHAVSEATEDLIEPQRMMLAPHIGGYLLGMRNNPNNQQLFADNALGIVTFIDEIVTAMADSKEEKDQDSKEKIEKAMAGFSLILYPEANPDAQSPGNSKPNYKNEYNKLVEQLASYKIFSTANDRIIDAEKLILPHQSKKLRAEQDKLIAGQGVNVPRLARDWTKILAAPRRDGWNFGEEEGYIDARRLTKLVTSPDFRQLFKNERHQPHNNCLVTFLIDNSGSMKEHISSIAMLVELMTKSLELAGASTEILGFTTRSWQGGKAFKQWRGRGALPNPGRLAELEHIIYKDAATPLKRARHNIVALLKSELFREGIDGEALLWAAARMHQRPEPRRILIVLSDGCPMETATNQANEPGYLDSHLRQVCAMLEARADIELYALGFGLDLSSYYRHSLALDLPQTLENGVFKEILQMIQKAN
jgi:cobaltochelatase CobT